MNKEQQDKLWNELSRESKEKVLARYNEAKYYNDAKDIDCYEDLFGTHHLNPKQIKTWEDVEKYYKAKGISTDYYVNFECGMGERIADKMIATAKIAKLIDLGYGGIVSKEEWRNKDLFKWNIVIGINGKPVIEGSYENWQEFISFHTKQQAEEFMSHESNRELIEQYYMM